MRTQAGACTRPALQGRRGPGGRDGVGMGRWDGGLRGGVGNAEEGGGVGWSGREGRVGRRTGRAWEGRGCARPLPAPAASPAFNSCQITCTVTLRLARASMAMGRSRRTAALGGGGARGSAHAARTATGRGWGVGYGRRAPEGAARIAGHRVGHAGRDSLPESGRARVHTQRNTAHRALLPRWRRRPSWWMTACSTTLRACSRPGPAWRRGRGAGFGRAARAPTRRASRPSLPTLPRPHAAGRPADWAHGRGQAGPGASGPAHARGWGAQGGRRVRAMAGRWAGRLEPRHSPPCTSHPLPMQGQPPVTLTSAPPPAPAGKKGGPATKGAVTVDSPVLAEHARQVHAMLPGGVGVAGMYLFAPGGLGACEGGLAGAWAAGRRACNAAARPWQSSSHRPHRCTPAPTPAHPTPPTHTN